MSPCRKKCEGAALIESCMVIILLCLILFGMLQLSLVTAAHDVNQYAASCGARCAAVGYDETIIEKAIRVAALPNLGPRPDLAVASEKEVIKEYLLSPGTGGLSYVPSDHWESLSGYEATLGAGKVRVQLAQNYPLPIPFVRAFYPDNILQLDSGDVEMMNHAALYLE